MPAPLSSDIRERVIRKWKANKTIKEIAEELDISVSSVNRIIKAYKKTESFEPKPMGGDRRSHKIEVYHDDILAILKEKQDATIDEIRKKLITRCGKKAKFSRCSGADTCGTKTAINCSRSYGYIKT